MSKTLQISNSLGLPLDAVTQKFAVLGRTGSGKSYCATKLCEEMLDAKAQVIALDPVGVWYGLRVDGAFDIPIFGGLHGDVPLEPGAGEFVANLIVDRGISAVLDVSQFESDAQKARFARDFATRFFFRKKSAPSAVHLFLEEAQEFVPQNPQRDEAMMLHAFQRIAKLGRNFGIGVTLISQRPQEVNKKALNQTECLFAFQMTGPQERKAIETWIAEKGVNEDIRELLPHLKVGECHIWSPQWLKTNETIKIAKKRSADVSSTPTSGGSKRAEPKPLSQGELEKFSAQMLETIERAKAEDPRELRKEIAQLKRCLTEAVANKGKPAKVEQREVPVLRDGQLVRLEKWSRDFESSFDKLFEKFAKVGADVVAPVRDAVLKVRDGGSPSPARESRALPNPTGISPSQISRLRPLGNAPRKIESTDRATPGPKAGAGLSTDGEFRLTSKQQQILDAIAFFESIGNRTPSTLQVGAIALIDASGGHFSNVVGPLSSNGLVNRGQGVIELTDKGREFARVPDAIGSLGDYHEMLRARVRKAKSAGGKTIEILNVIISRGGAEVTTEEIGREASIDHTGGHFSNMIGPLSTIGLIKRDRGLVRPTEILFPEGIA